MRLLYKSRLFLSKMIAVSYSLGQLKGELRKKKNPNRVARASQVVLTAEQKKAINELYKSSYGKKIKYDWHKYYQSFMNSFDANYFVEYLFSTKLEPLLNPVDYRYVLADKTLLHVFCDGIDNIRVPKVFFVKYGDILISDDKKIVSFQKVNELLEDRDYIIKPAQDTNSGAEVVKVKGGDAVKKVLCESKRKGLIVQECVKQHQLLQTIYPYSLNTFRVITYILDGNIYHMPIALRFGKNESFVDNFHSGGLFIGVSDNGNLQKYAFTESNAENDGKYEAHPDTGVVFKDYHFDFIPEIIDTAKRMHLNTPQLGMISWDISVDDKNNFVLIEANTYSQSIGSIQGVNGRAAFGENTKKILKLIAK